MEIWFKEFLVLARQGHVINIITIIIIIITIIIFVVVPVI